MPTPCCVPGCRGNYKNGPRVSVFGFPADADLAAKWEEKIHREEEFKHSAYTKVCELHFEPHDVIRSVTEYDPRTGKSITVQLDRPRLAPGAVPSQFPNCPDYLSKPTTAPRVSPADRATAKENEQLAQALNESMDVYDEQCERYRVKSLQDIRMKLHVESETWSISQRENCVRIFKLDNVENPQITASVVIDAALNMNANYKNTPLPRINETKFPCKVDNIQIVETVINALDHLTRDFSRDENAQFEADNGDANFVSCLGIVLGLLLPFKSSGKFGSLIWLMCEQIELMLKKRLNYSPDFLVFSSVFHCMSPTAYRYLRDTAHLILPSYSTIRRLTLNSAMSPAMEQSDSTFLFYIKQKFKSLSASDLHISLLIDEIHLKKFFDYKCGNIVGTAYDNTAAATTAFVFMITSLFSKFKEVVHVLPTSTMTGENLFEFIKKTVIGLEEIGFTVFVVITDNNAINGKAMSLFANPPALQTRYVHPSNSERPLFFLFDSVHIMKCVRNNWLNLKNTGLCFTLPKFSFRDMLCSSGTGNFKASFEALRRLYRVDSGNLLTFSYRLSSKALAPSSIERQKVSLALDIFNEYVSQALLSLGAIYNIKHYLSTSLFIRIILTWWSVVNVKTSGKGIRHRNDFEKPLTSAESISKAFLRYFIEWLVKWGTKGASLTRETFTALLHTSRGLLEVSEYCFSQFRAKYVLLGKFQTDSLEARFGQYRQMAGGMYNVTMRQVFECEKKIRSMSVLKLKLNGQDVTLSEFSLSWDEIDSSFTNESVEIEVSETDYENAEKFLPVITYLAGYCCHSISRKLKCQGCLEKIVLEDADTSSIQNSYIGGITRGGLLYPQIDVVKIVQLTYLVIEKLVSEDIFLRLANQRDAAVTTCLQAVVDEGIDLLDGDACTNGHKPLKVVKMIIWITSNALLNNYSKMLNDALDNPKLKRRKLQTLSH